MEDNKQHGIWISLSIAMSKDLSGNEKLLFGYINGFCRKELTCFATNRSIAKIIGVTPGAVSQMINKLKKLGFINIKKNYYRNSHKIKNRILIIKDSQLTTR